MKKALMILAFAGAVAMISSCGSKSGRKLYEKMEAEADSIAAAQEAQEQLLANDLVGTNIVVSYSQKNRTWQITFDAAGNSSIRYGGTVSPSVAMEIINDSTVTAIRSRNGEITTLH